MNPTISRRSASRASIVPAPARTVTIGHENSTTVSEVMSGASLSRIILSRRVGLPPFFKSAFALAISSTMSGSLVSRVTRTRQISVVKLVGCGYKPLKKIGHAGGSAAHADTASRRPHRNSRTS